MCGVRKKSHMFFPLSSVWFYFLILHRLCVFDIQFNKLNLSLHFSGGKRAVARLLVNDSFRLHVVLFGKAEPPLLSSKGNKVCVLHLSPICMLMLAFYSLPCFQYVFDSSMGVLLLCCFCDALFGTLVLQYRVAISVLILL